MDMNIKNKYSDCFYCGGKVEEQLLPREIRLEDKLLIVENVPMGVCVQCGEKALKPEVAESIDRIIREKKKPAKTISVPVYSF